MNDQFISEQIANIELTGNFMPKLQILLKIEKLVFN
jgi:hypothetical protein